MQSLTDSGVWASSTTHIASNSSRLSKYRTSIDENSDLRLLDPDFISLEFGPSVYMSDLEENENNKNIITIRKEKAKKPIQSNSDSNFNLNDKFSPAKPIKEKNKRKYLLRIPEYKETDRLLLEGWTGIKRIPGSSLPSTSIKKPELWKYRYCELERNCLFQYRMTPKDQFVLSDESEINYKYQGNNPSSVLLSNNQLGYTFTISSLQVPNKKKIVLAAPSCNSLHEWTNAIIEGKENEKIRKKGTLFYCSSFRQKWKPFDVFLAGRVLQLFSRDHQHAFNLVNCFLEKSPNYNRVLSLGNSNETIYLYFRVLENFNTWYSMLEKEIIVCNSRNEENDISPLPKTETNFYTSPEYISFCNDINQMLACGKEENIKRITNFIERKPKIHKLLSSSSSSFNDKSKKPYFILSLDGGGLRGILSIILLERIQDYFYDILDHVSLFAGTSTGSIIASGLSFGHSLSTLRTLFETKGGNIFSNPISKFKNVSQAKYDNKWLRAICEESYGKTTLNECPKKLLISSFLLNNEKEKDEQAWEPRIYHNLKDSSDMNSMLVSDVILYSTAAPTFFPSVNKHIDGAVFDQNPSSSALNISISPKNGNIPLSDVVLLSIGTGKVPRWINDEQHNWGIGQWLPKLTNLLWDGMVLKSEIYCKELLDSKYHRCDTLLNEEVPMDDPSAIPELEYLANNIDISDTLKWVAKNIYGIDDYKVEIKKIKIKNKK